MQPYTVHREDDRSPANVLVTGTARALEPECACSNRSVASEAKSHR